MGKVFGLEGTPRGLGNQVSAEFNLAYRWHSCISDKDDKWTQNLYQELFGKSGEEVSMVELLQGLGKWEHSLDKDPHKRPFAGLKRDADGKFADDDLAAILTESVEDMAGKISPVTIANTKVNDFRRFRSEQYPEVSEAYYNTWVATGEKMGSWVFE